MLISKSKQERFTLSKQAKGPFLVDEQKRPLSFTEQKTPSCRQALATLQSFPCIAALASALTHKAAARPPYSAQQGLGKSESLSARLRLD